MLGDDVQQRGSSVTDKRLTFDFTHDRSLTKDEIILIENNLAEEINADIKTVSKNMKYNDAINSGALAFFEEKYSFQTILDFFFEKMKIFEIVFLFWKNQGQGYSQGTVSCFFLRTA